MTPSQVLEEWFGELDADGGASEETRKRWFAKDATFDAHLKANYESAVDSAARGELGWGDSAEERLAEIILLDQFCRNIHRGSADMYKGDERARRLAQQLLSSTAYQTLPTAQQAFVCMPLMHSEQLEDQDTCVRCFEQLEQQCPESQKDAAANYVKYARAHRDIVAKFGRFPHRNALLNRASSPEEVAFLETPGSSF